MPKAYRVTRHRVVFDKENPREVYGVAPVNYGTLTTDDAAAAISEGSTVTTGDVKAVLDRYAQYVKENLKKGYAIQLLGFGTLSLRFRCGKAADSPDKATAAMVRSIVPSFTPSFTLLNGYRKYDLVPDRIQLVKYGGGAPETVEGTPSEGESQDPVEDMPDPID